MGSTRSPLPFFIQRVKRSVRSHALYRWRGSPGDESPLVLFREMFSLPTSILFSVLLITVLEELFTNSHMVRSLRGDPPLSLLPLDIGAQFCPSRRKSSSPSKRTSGFETEKKTGRPDTHVNCEGKSGPSSPRTVVVVLWSIPERDSLNYVPRILWPAIL